ncbi:MAG: cbb3-type cytochrome c oxidase subunit 3 [Pseudomonadota bacterium]
METYTFLRAFADSWMLLAMFLFFLGMILRTFRPGLRKTYEDIAQIPLRDDAPVSQRYPEARALQTQGEGT